VTTEYRQSDLPLSGQVLAVVDFDAPTDGNYERPTEEVTSDAANLITSKVRLGTDVESAFGTTLHKPVIDIDLPVKVVESSTPGHHHLYIDKAMSWEKYRHLLEALAVAGLVEPGYVNASIDRGYSAVRLPWIHKGEPVPATPDTVDTDGDRF
jgi:hypothetical protein